MEECHCYSDNDIVSYLISGPLNAAIADISHFSASAAHCCIQAGADVLNPSKEEVISASGSDVLSEL